MKYLFPLFLLIPLLPFGTSQHDKSDPDPIKLKNPITVDYLKKNLPKKGPYLILTKEIKKELQQKTKTDPVVMNYYAAIKLNAQQIMEEPFLTRKKIGRRLLSTSREMLYRMGVLGMVYTVDKDKEVLQRIDQELLAICNFSDWNPSHYLDVAEMSLALALAIDWVGDELPKTTLALVKENLITKGIKPSYNKKGNVGWINGNNNWNQVCHAGMIAASLVIVDKDPELAAKTIHRAIEGIPHAMEEYGPDGVYPEGSTYWGYGTSFTVLTIAMFESAFGTDFGLADYPAFLESADFRVLANTPSGMYYNFADCGDRRSQNPDITLAWFAKHTGNARYFEKERFLNDAKSMQKLSRIAGPALVWVSQFEPRETRQMPTAWKGEGSNPIVIFTSNQQGRESFYFGGKGGRGTVNHGNMDGGSFIFELNGVRWVIDPGNQPYHELEKTGFNLWGRCQDCERWTLLTKNNYGHSTLTVNDELHIVDGMSRLVDFQDQENPEATFDLTPAFGNLLDDAKRTFKKMGADALVIEDRILKNENTENVTWQLMTAAEVDIFKGGATLSQDGKQLTVTLLSHPELTPSVISLDPPPLALDRKMEGLKRIELRLPAYLLADDEVIKVRLSPKQ